MISSTRSAKMTYRFLIVIALLLTGCATQQQAMRGEVLQYGVVSVTSDQEDIATPGTPNGISTVFYDPPKIYKNSSEVPAVLGTRFGVWYRIINVPVPDGEVEVTKFVSHPEMLQPDGTKSKGFTFVDKQPVKGGQIIWYTGYGFDDPYEVLPGKWKFEMSVLGKVVVTQEFTVR